MVAFSKALLEFRWISWFKWALAQGPILHPHNHKAQGKVHPLGLMPIMSDHMGNLQRISYWVQDVQFTAICLSGAGGVFEDGFLQGSHCHCNDLVVCAHCFGHTSRPRHPQQSICINVSLPCPIVQLRPDLQGKCQYEA